MLTEDDILKISGRIVQGYAPLAVGIFGSYAVGTAGAQSDLDIFVIALAPGDVDTRVRAVKRLLFGVLHPLDIFVFTPREFEERAYEEQSFTWMIVQQARLHHWTEEARRLVPSLFTRVSAQPE
jgi:predicted nucleotidyltransferase